MLRKAISSDTAAGLFGAERTLLLLRATWPLAVGPSLAERTEVVGLEGRTLIVRVPDARWRKILHRLRREAGPRAPRALGFVEAASTGPAPLALEPAAGEQALPGASEAAAPASVSGAESIADPELRSLFEGAAGRYLARGRGR
jgi:Dna[CI] antecedent DciA-like protein